MMGQKTMTLNLDIHCKAIVEEASAAMGVSQSDFIRTAIKFAATANAVFSEHPQTTVGICGPKAFPSLTRLEMYAWAPLWTPPNDSEVHRIPVNPVAEARALLEGE